MGGKEITPEGPRWVARLIIRKKTGATSFVGIGSWKNGKSSLTDS